MTENKALIYPKECIKDVAESLNINNLSDEIATALAQDVEYRLNQVIQESIKFMRHSQREKLMVDDINHALRVQNVEPLYGFNGPNNIDFKKINHNNQELYYLNDTEVSFDTLFDAPLPSVPPEMSFTAHWLAIEGVQPVIPQNPVEKEVEDKPSPAKKPKNIPDETTEPAKLEIKSSVKHKLPKELQVYFEKIASAVVSTEESLRVTAYQSLAEDPGLAQLLPYFVNFCSQKISDSLKDFQTLSYILNMISAIMRSPFLDIQHYLHQLMPAILSCTFAKAYENESTDLHWQVRRQAAALVNRVYTDFGEIHQSVKTKLIKTIHEALLNPNKPLSSCCGALILLPMLGEQPFRESVVTNLLIIGNRLTLKLSHNNQRIVGEARYCINQIVKSLEDIVKNHEENIPKDLPQPDDEQVIARVSRGVQQVLKESTEYSRIWWYLQNPKQIDTFKV